MRCYILIFFGKFFNMWIDIALTQLLTLGNRRESPLKMSLPKKDVESVEDFYSILLPTYNEKDNLPLIIWLILKYMNER